MAPRALIFGCEGPRLSDWEADFFRDVNPLGFILFARNCETPDQIRALVAQLKESIGRSEASILIDQEGGRVQRLKPPTWRAAPAPGCFGRLAQRDEAAAIEAVTLNARLLASEVLELGVTVDCIPLLDLQFPNQDQIIGDRSYSDDPLCVATLARACCKGLLAGGVLPVIKHIPGHGRATVDSHLALPHVSASLEALEATDFKPFQMLCDMPWAMTAHVVYEAIDPESPATTSKRVIDQVIRGSMKFDGMLVSDDLSMKALEGGFGARATAALQAGCDLALHCNGDAEEMLDIAAAVGPLSDRSLQRLEAANSVLQNPTAESDSAVLATRVNDLLSKVA